MKLNKEQKLQLQELKNHPWYKILEMIEKEATGNLWELLLTANLEDEKNLEIIKKNQQYMKARRDFFHNIETHIKEIYSPEIEY